VVWPHDSARPSRGCQAEKSCIESNFSIQDMRRKRDFARFSLDSAFGDCGQLNVGKTGQVLLQLLITLRDAPLVGVVHLNFLA
jgi:hypothetical protein